jgi:hypothetical protein
MSLSEIDIAKMIQDKKNEFNQDFGDNDEFKERYGPFVTYYNAKKNCVVHNPNPGFAALLKANYFKIDNPPYYCISNKPDIEWDAYNEKEIKNPNLVVFLEFTLPIKVNTYDGEKNITIEYLLEMDVENKFTKKCYFNMSHYYVEDTKEQNKKEIIYYLEKKLKKCREDLWERNLPPILKYLKDYDNEEQYELRLRQMVDVFNRYNHNFLHKKKQILFYEEAISFVETSNKWW